MNIKIYYDYSFKTLLEKILGSYGHVIYNTKSFWLICPFICTSMMTWGSNYCKAISYLTFENFLCCLKSSISSQLRGSERMLVKITVTIYPKKAFFGFKIKFFEFFKILFSMSKFYPFFFYFVKVIEY